MDHVDGGGTQEIKRLGYHRMLRRILAGASGYQLLCANCNWIKRHENRETFGAYVVDIPQTFVLDAD